MGTYNDWPCWVTQGHHPTVDGRTLRAVRRYRLELRTGVDRSGKALRPFALLTRADRLLKLGFTFEQVMQLAKPPRRDYDEAEMAVTVSELVSGFGIDPRAFEAVGVRRMTVATALLLEPVGPYRVYVGVDHSVCDTDNPSLPMCSETTA